MATKVPTQSVVVVRNGKRVTPPLGKGFNFTAAEIAELAESAPEALRDPVNESEHDSQHDVRSAAGRVVEGGANLTDEGEGQMSDEEIEEANANAEREQAVLAAEKAGDKAIAAHGGNKAVKAKAAAKAAAAKVDDL